MNCIVFFCNCSLISCSCLEKLSSFFSVSSSSLHSCKRRVRFSSRSCEFSDGGAGVFLQLLEFIFELLDVNVCVVCV